MNILYIEHYAGSLDMGMEFRPYYLCREWQKAGHNTRIVCASFSHLRSFNPNIEKDFEIKTIDGVEYQFVKTCEYKGNGAKRVLSMFQFVSKIKRHARKIVREFKPDVVITSSTYPLDVYAACKIAKIAKCKYVHEAHDVWPLTLIEIGHMSRFNPFVVLLSIGEKKTYKKAQAIVSVLPFSYEHMLKKGLKSKDMFFHIPNGISLGDWEDGEDVPDEHKKLLSKLREEGKFIIEYLGGHALSNRLELLIDAAKRTKGDENISYVLIGKGVKKNELETEVTNNNLQNVFFLPPISKKGVPTALKMADALYIGGYDTGLTQFGVSLNKVYDYMMAGKPILYGFKSRNNEVLEANSGLCFDPDDTDSLVDAIYQIKEMSQENRKELGDNGRKWVLENCEYKVLADKFMKVIEGIDK